MSHPVWREGDRWDPRNPENRDRTRALVPQLREQLLVWDPIGVASAPEAQDEYDCLISPLLHRLDDGTSEMDIADWLVQELHEHFGLRADPERERVLASSLKRWSAKATSA